MRTIFVMDRPSLWHATASLPTSRPLEADAEADVVVVGGGIAGVTAALLLQRAGRRTLLLEAWRLGSRETGHTTAHLTELLDARYHALESRVGRDAAGLAGASARAAMNRIEAFAAELGQRACGFARVPAYLVAVNDRERRELQHELAALQRAGADAGWTDDVPYPLPVERAIRVERQAQLHPLAYLAGLAGLLAAAGGRIHEHTRALAVQDGAPCRVETERGTVRAPWVIVLTNHPISSRFAIHTKIAAYRTYAVALGPAAPDRFRAGLLYDMADPYHYVRTQHTSDGTFLVVGGEDHKTGHGRGANDRFAALERWARRLGPDLPPAHRWSGQIVEPADGLPFIGRSPGAANVLVGTGFSGTGMTFGTLAAELLAGEITGQPSRYASLFDAGRVRPIAQGRRFLAENADVAATLFARDRLSRGEVPSVDEIPRGEGRLVRSGGSMLAVSRDEDGTVTSRSATCRHLGCHVQWNQAERSWDCPCHGSRYDVAGAVLNGPTTKPLEEEPSPAGAKDERPQA